MSDLHDQIIDLQTRVAYHEDTIAHLNDVITQQDSDIIQLKRQMHLLGKRLDELLSNALENEADITNERPPHY